MRKCDVKSPEDALLYLADCQLATCEDLASKKSRGASDYDRQKNIAQLFCNWISDFKVNVDEGNRVGLVKLKENSVEEYLREYDVKAE